ncbi:hypothetical protein Tco_1564261 [Tanacetum coccineum]
MQNSVHQLSRSPVEVAQSFNFSVVTTLVNISARFSAPRIFVKDKAHSLTIIGYSDILSLYMYPIGTAEDVNLVSLSNSFEALNVKNPVIKEVATVSKATTFGTQESSTLIVDKFNVLEKQILESKLVFVDDDEKPLEKVDYSGNTGSEDEAEPVDNETTSYLALKEVGYGPKSLWEQ